MVKFGVDIATTDDYSYFIPIRQRLLHLSDRHPVRARIIAATPTGQRTGRTIEQAVGNPVVNTRDQRLRPSMLQDQWRITPKLTLNFGARYEYEQVPQPKVCNPIYTQTCHINSPTTDLMPRLGVAYQLGQQDGLARWIRDVLLPDSWRDASGSVQQQRRDPTRLHAGSHAAEPACGRSCISEHPERQFPAGSIWQRRAFSSPRPT